MARHWQSSLSRFSILFDEYRTKAGTEWDKLAGLEKIILLYKINFIIVKYREHLKKKKQNKNNS